MPDMVEMAGGLKRLRGIGSVLAKRLSQAGLDSVEKIAEEGEEGLRKIPGMPTRMVGSIVQQARQLVHPAQAGQTQRQPRKRATSKADPEKAQGSASPRKSPPSSQSQPVSRAPSKAARVEAQPAPGESSEPGQGEQEEALKRRLAEVRESVQGVAQSAKERYQQELSGKKGKKLSSDLIRMEDALQKLDSGGQRSRRAGKALAKAQKRMSGLEDAPLKKLRKRVKRARKNVLKALK